VRPPRGVAAGCPRNQVSLLDDFYRKKGGKVLDTNELRVAGRVGRTLSILTFGASSPEGQDAEQYPYRRPATCIFGTLLNLFRLTVHLTKWWFLESCGKIRETS